MIRSVLTLNPPPEQVAGVLALYAREQVLQRSMDEAGAVAAEISVAADGSGDLLVTALWPDAAAYQGWLDHAFRAEFSAELDTLLNGRAGTGRTYTVVGPTIVG